MCEKHIARKQVTYVVTNFRSGLLVIKIWVFLFLFLFFVYLFVCLFFIGVDVGLVASACASHVCSGAPGGQKRASHTLELQLQSVVSHHVGVENRTLVL